MFRKTALAMALLGSLTAGQAVALGLGDIELKSALNQPLDAEVELLSATDAEMKEMKVVIGSNEAFEKAGIERPLFLSRLRFSVVRNDQGTPVIHITSNDVVREPFLDFLLEISWSKGRLLREYTVLVDPPVTMPAAAPATRAPAARTGSGYAPAQTATRVQHTGLPPVTAAPGEYGPTRRNDTLWKIAEQVRPDEGVSMEQTMLGLLRANPEAFVDNNINNLKAGYILRVPDRADMLSVSRGQALREARSQYSAWKQANGFAPLDGDATVVSGAVADSAPVAAAEDSSLQLVAPDADELTTGSGSADQLEKMRRELMMANEAMEAQRRESEDMASRLTLLEEQIQNMQRLIQLKDNELARLQHAAGEGMTDDLAAGETLADAEGTAVAEDVTAADLLVPAEAVVEVLDETMVDETAETASSPFEAESGSVGGSGELEGPLAEDAAGEMPLDPEAALMEELLAEDAELLAEDPLEPGATPADFESGQLAEAGVEEDGAGPVVETEVVEPAPVVASEPQSAAPVSFVDRLMANPMWLAAGGLVVALLAFFGLRRKRGVDTEFQESILQAAQESSTAASDSEIAAASESRETASAESSLLSEFAVSDMGSLKNDGEADPLAEADVYLAYGRFQQAEELIRDALARSPEHEELNLKMLEVLQAGQNQAAFDEHAQAILARLENSDNPMWEKVSEMGREISPDNPMYQAGAVGESAADESESFEPMDFGGDTGLDDVADDTMPETGSAEASGEEGLAFDIDLSFDDAEEKRGENTPDSEAFTPEVQPQESASAEPALNVDMDTVEPDSVEQNTDLDIDLENFEFGENESAAADEELAGDGELADLDEVSTKLDLARAYIDMGDPDGAKGILDEVMEEGNEEQKNEAQDILGQLA